MSNKIPHGSEIHITNSKLQTIFLDNLILVYNVLFK